MSPTDAQIEAAARARADLIRARHGFMPMRDDEFESYLVDRPDEVEEIRAALAAAEEAGPWEYRIDDGGSTITFTKARANADRARLKGARVWRRRPSTSASAWLPVEGSEE